MSNQPIGIFDSGIGGLTVYKSLKEILPFENFIYLGDTARVPYGTKSRETVARYSIRNTLFLLEEGIKALVVACNTASAYGLESLTKHFKIPVIGVIEPGAVAALKVTKNNHIGVIGTEGTIGSGAYQVALKKQSSDVQISVQACSLLVALAEEGITEGPIVDLVLDRYLATLADSKIDTLILGCTHFPLFKNSIIKKLGPQVTLVDSATETAKMLKKVLEDSRLLNDSHSKGFVQIYSTDAPERMQTVGKHFLGDDLNNVQKIDLSGF